MNPRPKQEPALGSPDKKNPTKRTKIIIMSSYKDQTTRETKKFQQKEQKGKNLEDTQTNKNNPNKNKQKGQQCGTSILTTLGHGPKTT